MGSIYTLVASEKPHVLQILADKWPALWDVIDPHGPDLLVVSDTSSHKWTSQPLEGLLQAIEANEGGSSVDDKRPLSDVIDGPDLLVLFDTSVWKWNSQPLGGLLKAIEANEGWSSADDKWPLSDVIDGPDLLVVSDTSGVKWTSQPLGGRLKAIEEANEGWSSVGTGFWSDQMNYEEDGRGGNSSAAYVDGGFQIILLGHPDLNLNPDATGGDRGLEWLLDGRSWG